jgi:hypothetical protein
VEGSIDGGQNWFTLVHQPATPARTISGTTVLTTPTYFNPGWNRRVVDVSPFTGPDNPPLHLRFRLIPGAASDRWWLDDVRVEEIIIPSMFAFPFEDDVEGLRYWDTDGSWARTNQQARSGNWAWQSGQIGEMLTLAGSIPVPEAVTPTLTFWQVVSPTTQGIVEVSTNNGVSWTPIYTTTAAEATWAKVEVTLNNAVGLTTTLRFRQEAGPAGGWLIDDIRLDQARISPVYHLPFTDDMENPTQNWLALGGWQPVTATAHSLQTSWRGQTDGSRLQLVGSLALSGTITPTLSFWQRFDLPVDSLGQVQVSSDDGLSWQPVLTLTTPITTWSPITVNLSAYTDQQIWLAFALISATTPLTNQGWYVDDVQVAETEVISVFLESEGQVVMEAEHFTEQIGQGMHRWLTQTNVAGYVSEGYLKAGPDVDVQFNDSYTTTSSELRLTFQIGLTGTYYLWLRGYAPNAAGDSLYLGLDGQPISGDNRLSGFAPRAWDWANGTMSASSALLEIDEPGLHTLHLWMREDGLLIDRVLLTMDDTYIPTGSGPSESVSRPIGAPP